MTETSQRYIVRELTGYHISPGAQGGKPTTDVMVLDAEDCYHVVAYYSGEVAGQRGTNGLYFRRLRARRLVEEYEREEIL